MDSVLPLWLDLLAVGVGALHGAVFATRKSVKLKFDIVGVIVLAIIMGLGGGIIRDMLIGEPIAAFQQNEYLMTAVVVGFVTMFFAHIFDNAAAFLQASDTLALGLFVLVGVAKAAEMQMDFLPVIMAGVITGIGGGVLRDLLSNMKPSVMLSSTYYALAATAGSVAYVICTGIDVSGELSALTCVLVVVGLRTVSIRYDLRSPEASRVSIKSFRKNESNIK